jgi:YVTN family beta-propeller protein
MRSRFKRSVGPALLITLGLVRFGATSSSSSESAPQYHDQLYIANYDKTNPFPSTVSIIDPSRQDPVINTVSVGGNPVMNTVCVGGNPVGVAVRPPNGHDFGRVYVTDSGSGSNCVSVIDAKTNMPISDRDGHALQIPVGIYPKAIAVSPDGKRAYVANFDGSASADARNGSPGGTVSVIDTTRDPSLEDPMSHPVQIPVGRGPSSAAVSPDSQFVYVTNTLDGTVSVIDAPANPSLREAAGKGATIRVGRYPVAITVSPDGRWVYVANLGDDTVSVINTQSKRTDAIVRGVRVPNNLVLVGRWLYVTSQFYKAVSIIDTESRQVADSVQVEGAPAHDGIAVICSGAAASPDGARIYITYSVEDSGGTALASSLVVLDTHSRKLCNRIQVATKSRSLGVAVSPDATAVYVANFDASVISIVDPTRPDPTVDLVQVGKNPEGVALASDGRVYVANSTENSISVIDTERSDVVDTLLLPLDSHPLTVAVATNPVGETIYASVFNPTLWVISVDQNGARTPVPVTLPITPSNSPFALAVSRNGQRIYVAGTDQLTRAPILLVLDATSSPPAPVLDGSGKPVEIPVGTTPYGVALSPDDRWIYVTNQDDGTLSVIDARPRIPVPLMSDTLGTPLRIAVGVCPAGIAVGRSKDGVHTYVYVATENNNQGVVSVIDASNEAVLLEAEKHPEKLATIPVGKFPTGIAVGADGTKVYVTNCGSNTVSVIDTATWRTHAIRVGPQPMGLAVKSAVPAAAAAPQGLLHMPNGAK